MVGQGSIPARAGQPRPHRQPGPATRVHPRASGATACGRGSSAHVRGPSPRERGNLVALLEPHVLGGSIPARAGQPSPESGLHRGPEVHPRASGATRACQEVGVKPRGPSPRERGNPRAGDRRAPGQRSIPARAGQPQMRSATVNTARVHPRASGATFFLRSMGMASMGPSPRERGNPLRVQLSRDLAGSIPARAGQPWSSGPGGW